MTPPVDRAERAAAIRSFLAGVFAERDLGLEEDIFSLGYVNSLFVMDLVLFIEGHFRVSVGRRELRIESFRTITAMLDLVERLTSEASGR